LAFVGKDGRSDWRPAQTFAREVGEHSSRRLVFLQACESAVADARTYMPSIAGSLVGHGVFAVIGMQARITNGQGVEFAVAFYKELAKGRPVDEAVRAGRQAVEDSEKPSNVDRFGPPPFAVPVLYLWKQEALFPRELKSTDSGTVARPRVAERAKRCQNCKKMLSPEDRFCGDCGWLNGCKTCTEQTQSPGRPFCTSCGRKVLAKSDVASCQSCKGPMDSVENFCGACGIKNGCLRCTEGRHDAAHRFCSACGRRIAGVNDDSRFEDRDRRAGIVGDTSECLPSQSNPWPGGN
jgi:hypothetical protein